MNAKEWQKKIVTLNNKARSYNKQYKELIEKHEEYINKKSRVDNELSALAQASNAYKGSPKGFSEKFSKLQNSSYRLAQLINKTEVEGSVLMRKINDTNLQLRDAHLAVECIREIG